MAARPSAETATQLQELQTPALLLDRDKLAANLERMRRHLRQFGVPLRPHLKTAKSAAVGRLAIEGQPGGITVQTLAEAEYFVAHGFADILYAVGIVPSKLARVAELQRRGAVMTIVLDSLEMAEAVQQAAREIGTEFNLLIEIDSDDHRSGIAPHDPLLLAIADQLRMAPGARLRGVMTHAGGSYSCRSAEEIAAMAERERAAVATAAERLRAAGHDCPVVSVGSTPTALFARSFEGVTEVRAGVYMFMDLVMADLGVCREEEIALSVLATVIGHNPASGRLMIDAGGLALSKDSGSGRRGGPCYGVLADAATGEPLGLTVTGANQEHGIVRASAADFERLPIGAQVRVLPNHACMTAAAYDHYHVLEGDRLAAVWDRCNGW